MRSHRSGCAIFCASLSILTGLTAATSHAQLTQLPPFYQNVWKATAPQSASTANTTADSSAARQAYFQGPGDMSMPQLPSTGMNNDSPVSPASFNQFSNPGGAMPATQVQQLPPAQLRDANSGSVQNPNAAYAQQPGSAYRNTSMQQPVFPPANTMAPNGYPVAPNGYPNGYPAQQLPASQLRNAPTNGPTNPALPGQPQAAPYQTPVVSADPRYVSPAPAQGRYPTSPYQPFRTVAYQLPQPAQPQVQPPSALPNQPQVAANTAVLPPQYQSTVGIQPISYQALQPGYNCVPGYAPGAIAPPTLPPNLTPQLYTPDNSGYRPLFSLGQENYNVQIGRGIIGQPTVYVPGQPVRNFMRYIFP